MTIKNLLSAWDVIVIGAGPAGSNAAYHLARRGWKVLLLEKESAPGIRKACGGVAMANLQTALSLPAAVREKEIGRVSFISSGGTTEWKAPAPMHLSFQRKNFDRFLAERAVRAGATLANRTRAVGAERRRVTVGARGNRKDSVLEAKIVIYADGVPTLAWKDRGIGFSPHDLFHELLVYELHAPRNRIDGLYYGLLPARKPVCCCWIFPKKDVLNVGAGRLMPGSGGPLKILLDDFCRDHPQTRGKRVLSRRAGIIPRRRARHLHSDNCLVVGDAGGLVDPVTGGGIHFALDSGALAARTCHLALKRGRYDAEMLSLYARSWGRSTDCFWIRLWEIVLRFSRLPPLRSPLNFDARILRSNIALNLWLYRMKNPA